MNIAMVLAGGSGTRMGIEIPKQFIEVEGKPLIIHTIESFQKNSSIDAIVMVCRSDYREKLTEWIDKYKLTKVKFIADNGDTRQLSVKNGLKAISGAVKADDVILIHDGARPLITDDIINRNIDGVKEFGAVNTVIPCTDTLVISKGGKSLEGVADRSIHYQCQTPQSFKYEVIIKAHRFAEEGGIDSATDDCQLVSKMGHNVHLVEGSKLNFKVTTREDLMILEAVIGKL